MKKITAILLTSALAIPSAHAYRDVLLDGAIGAAAGAVIGNNMGKGDAETGAVIGGVSAIIFGEKGRSTRRQVCYPSTSPRTVAVVKSAPTVQAHEKEVEVQERVWVPEETVTDASGNVLYTVPGHHETRVVKKTIIVYR